MSDAKHSPKDDREVLEEQEVAEKPENAFEESEQTSKDDGDLITQLEDKILELEDQAQVVKNQALRAQADYQNLVRRSRDEQSTTIRLATKSLVTDLLEPLEHLSMTTDQLKDKVLGMVVQQLWSKLNAHGLEEIPVMGKPFDLEVMEVIDLVDGATEKDGVVVKIVKRGYMLNGAVLQHAKVVIGKK